MDLEKTFIFEVQSMHCKACEMMIENELRDVPYVISVKSNLNTHSVEVKGYFGEMAIEEAAIALTKFTEKHGYVLSPERETRNLLNKPKTDWKDFKIAIPIAAVFVVLFVVLQKIGIVNLININNVSYGTAFVIGIIASLSTCMAVVGGLLLSMSATFAKEGDPSTSLRASKVKPQILFHLGRIVSFFVLGGIIGMIGSAFTLNISATFVLNLVIGIVMLILGINLLDVFHFSKKLQIGMPRFISKHAFGISKFNHSLTPLLVGVATFFLPCGFTQSMQLYTLSVGNFWEGGLTMLAFALGTLPVLALISFSSFSIKNNSKSGIFFKSAGLIVIMFAIFNLINSLVVMNLISPIFNF